MGMSCLVWVKAERCHGDRLFGPLLVVAVAGRYGDGLVHLRLRAGHFQEDALIDLMMISA